MTELPQGLLAFLIADIFHKLLRILRLQNIHGQLFFMDKMDMYNQRLISFDTIQKRQTRKITVSRIKAVLARNLLQSRVCEEIEFQFLLFYMRHSFVIFV